MSESGETPSDEGGVLSVVGFFGGIDFAVDLPAKDLEPTNRSDGTAVVGRLPRQNLEPDDVRADVEGSRGQDGGTERQGDLEPTACVHCSSRVSMYRIVWRRLALSGSRRNSPGVADTNRA